MGTSLTDAFSKLGASAAEAGKAFEKLGGVFGNGFLFDVADTLKEEQAALLAQAPTADPMVAWIEQELDVAMDEAVRTELARGNPKPHKFEPPPTPGERKIDLDD